MIAAMTSAAPPHSGHTRTSNSRGSEAAQALATASAANTRAISLAQGKYRGRKKEPAACYGGGVCDAAGIGGSVRSRMTASRHFAPGAKTP